jgi:hypothetical protein
MGCHLGWHFTVGCPLRGGRGKCKIIGTSVPPKTIKEKINKEINPKDYSFKEIVCQQKNYLSITLSFC